MNRFTRSDRPDRCGQALVEFALIVPLFVIIAIGIFEGGRAIYTYNAVSNAVNEGLREAIVNQDDASIEAETDRVLGGIANDSTVVIDRSDCGTPVKTPCAFRIEIRHDFSPILLGSIFRPVIAAEGEMAVEAVNP